MLVFGEASYLALGTAMKMMYHSSLSRRNRKGNANTGTNSECVERASFCSWAVHADEDPQNEFYMNYMRMYTEGPAFVAGL